MKNKVKKDLNVISGEFVKKASKKMKVFSKDTVSLKEDNKLNAKEKKNKNKREPKIKLKKGKIK